jgi:hypothetical protein
MDKPSVGDKLKLIGFHAEPQGAIVEVRAVHDRLDVWWSTATGEDKVALMDVLELYGEALAKSAEWYAEVDMVEAPGESMAVASFEVEPA